jgi:flagellar protein FliO/FliZ
MTIRQPSSTQRPFRAKALAALAASLLYHLFCPFMLLAAEQLTGATGTAAAPLLTANQETISLTTAIFKTLGSLIIVIGLMLLLLFWVKKMGFTKGGSRTEGLITVLDSQMLAAKKQVSVLEVAGTYLVIGLGEQQITLLATLEPNERLTAASQKRSTPLPPTFAAMLQKAAQGVSGLKQKKEGSANAE